MPNYNIISSIILLISVVWLVLNPGLKDFLSMKASCLIYIFILGSKNSSYDCWCSEVIVHVIATQIVIYAKCWEAISHGNFNEENCVFVNIKFKMELQNEMSGFAQIAWNLIIF